jgi:Ser/Thr protein kinase RdoA (MazF antagonist)
MTTPFCPDIFSTSRPGWAPVLSHYSTDLKGLSKQLHPDFLPIDTQLEQSRALGINSNNFRITARNGQWILKRWANSANSSHVQQTLDLMLWLNSQGLPVPPPAKFRDGHTLMDHGSNLWSLFPYRVGDYFSGNSLELAAAASMINKLFRVLAECPASLLPPQGPKHLTDEDDKVIASAENCKNCWPEIFGEQEAKLLNENWRQLIATWTRLRRTSVDLGSVQPVHFDLHPHNLLIQDSRVSAILDFESCKRMPVFTAVAFAALKLCRQAVVANGNSGAARSITTIFIDGLKVNRKDLNFPISHFNDFALTEVLRRICVILRLNIENSDATWNRVLPIQLRHLQESPLLFCK